MHRGNSNKKESLPRNFMDLTQSNACTLYTSIMQTFAALRINKDGIPKFGLEHRFTVLCLKISVYIYS